MDKPIERTIEQLRREVLAAESHARGLMDGYENRYARAHLKEVSAFMNLALAQIEYATLAASNPPDRTRSNPGAPS